MFFCFKKKTAYEMRISDWSSDVCSSDLAFPFEVLDALAKGNAAAPQRIGFTPDLGGAVPVARETREICAAAARRFEEIGSTVEEASPEIGRASCRGRVCQSV